VSDYQYDEHAVIPRRIKCHFNPATIVEVASAHVLRVEVATRPDWGFVVVKVFAARAAFKKAQFAWLQKMITDQKPETEIEL
jgi:hypothetical protein